MLVKVLLLLILLFLAYGYAVWLLKRLANTSQQIAELRSQLLKNDEALSAKVAVLEVERAREAAKNAADLEQTSASAD